MSYHRINATTQNQERTLLRLGIPCRDPKPTVACSWHFLHYVATQTCTSLFLGISCTSNSLLMHLVQYSFLYTYYTGSIKFGKTFQHSIERVKISFYYKTSYLHIPNWINCPEFYELHNKTKIWPSSKLRPQMYPPLGVPPAFVNVFPRRGEQCPIEELSYKGYSPPKCTYNGKHTHIQVKICTFLLECLHSMPHVLSPRQLPHTCICNVWKTVFKTKGFFFLKTHWTISDIKIHWTTLRK